MTADTLVMSATAFLNTLDGTASPHGSIGRRDTPPRERHDAFLRSLADVPNTGAATLAFRETIGEGGMGVVRVAVQLSVSREVAVKSLRPEPRTSKSPPAKSGATGLPPGAERLLEEAWITGAIEHPNVVPIYDITRGDDGNPLVVMRRIAGRSWGEALADIDARTRAGDEAWLEAHLRILIQVANAISAAHAQGIVHRDLKPDNVMLGQYGEVYVVDWGIAVLVEPSKHAHLPVLAADPSVVGTPCYMAPEMLAGEASRSTDVYLLGAIAFELATGAAPHDRPTMGAAVMSIVDSPPSIPDQVDAGLRSILTRSLAKDPGDRFPSAKSFAEAIEHYLLTRASVQTAHIGNFELAELERAVENVSDASPSLVEGLFSAARFSYQAAIRQWSDNDVARRGLVRTYVSAGTFALRRDDPDRALTVARSAPEFARSDVAIVALERAAEQAGAARRERLETLARRGDVESGIRTRNFIASCTTLLWLIMTSVSWWHMHTYGRGIPHELLAGALTQLVVWSALTIWARDTMRKTDFNRKIVKVGYVIPLYLAGLAAVLEWSGFTHTQVFQMGVVGFCGLLVSLAVFFGERLVSLAVLFFCLGAAWVVKWPEWRYIGLMGALLAGFAATLVITIPSLRKTWMVQPP